MVYLVCGLVLMPVVVLATLGGNVTWFAMFAGEFAVVVFYFVTKKLAKKNTGVTCVEKGASDEDDEGLFEHTYSAGIRFVPPVISDDE